MSGGVFLATFLVEVCHPQFLNGTIGYIKFCENDSLG